MHNKQSPRRDGPRTISTPRSVAFDVLLAVESKGAYSNLLLPTSLATSDLSAEGRKTATEMVYGTLRMQGFYDAVIEQATKRLISELDASVRVVLRLGAHQILNMRTPSHAVVSEMVSLAKKKVGHSISGLVNAALRRVSEKSVEDWQNAVMARHTTDVGRCAAAQAHPEWIVGEFELALEHDGRTAELGALLDANNTRPLVTAVRMPGFLLSIPPGATSTRYSPVGFSLTSGGDPQRLAGFDEGTTRIQDEGSQLAALALSHAQPVQHGESWLDLCSGPGGKAALLAAEAHEYGAVLTCNEINSSRARLVRDGLRAFPAVEVKTSDGRDWGAAHPHCYDRILLDAPCSGLGSLRRRPESRWRKTPEDVSTLRVLQDELVDSAVAALKPGGILAYVTCTPVLNETVKVVEDALHRYPALSQLNAWEVLDDVTKELLPRAANRVDVQLWPHVHGTDAMYIALLRKDA